MRRTDQHLTDAGTARACGSLQGSWAHPRVAAMRDHDRPGADLRALLELVEAASPTDAIEVVADELAAMVGAHAVSFLIADFSGRALVRFGTPAHGAPGARLQGTEQAETVPLAGTVYERVLRTQQVDVHELADGAQLTVPVTDRGDAIGVIELTLPRVSRRTGDRRRRRHRARTRLRGHRQPPPHRPVRVGPAHHTLLAGRRDPTAATSRPPTPAKPASSPSPAGWNPPAPSAATPSTTTSTARRYICRSPTRSGTRSRRRCWPPSWSAACATVAAAD